MKHLIKKIAFNENPDIKSYIVKEKVKNKIRY